MKPIAQEQSMGCGVACVASLLGRNYKETLKLFSDPKSAGTKGYFLKDLIYALNKVNPEKKYSFNKAKKNQKIKIGDIVFIDEPKPYGHYLLKTKQGWMNPWINSPDINPAKAGFQKKINGKILWVLFEEK